MSISPTRIALVAGGGALLAAWLTAATTAPREGDPEVTPTRSDTVPAQREGDGQDGSVAPNLAADLERLRLQAADSPALEVGARNPFSLAPPAPLPRAARPMPSGERPGTEAVSWPAGRVGPAYELIGVATGKAEDGAERIGILIAPDGGVLLVAAGDRIPGGYLVDAVEPSSVTLASDAETRHRLVLP
jgi:hypothetical protein